MIPSTITNPLLFSLPLLAYIVAVAESFDYPNQKYVLFKKLPDGRIRKVETFNEPISREEAISRYGDDRYMLQSMKPRAKVIWNHLSASSKEETEKSEVHDIDLRPLQQKTDHLGYGLLGSFGTQALGFGLSHSRFSQIEDRVAKVETALRSLPVQGLAALSVPHRFLQCSKNHVQDAGARSSGQRTAPPRILLVENGLYHDQVTIR